MSGRLLEAEKTTRFPNVRTSRFISTYWQSQFMLIFIWFPPSGFDGILLNLLIIVEDDMSV